VRNLFDQYLQPENRLTHALVCTLDADRALLQPFLGWAGTIDIPPARQLRITEQQVPGDLVSGDEEEGRGLPDACVFNDKGWALVVEAKVQAGISPDQLRRHIATAQRYGFEKPFVLLIAVDDPPSLMPDRALHRAWRDVYSWFRDRADTSVWARRFTTYMETFESRMIALNYSIRGTLTMFDGLRFDEDNPYTYREGKRLIRLLGDELQKRKDLHKIGVDPRGARRSAITGRSGTAVWDFLPLKAARGASTFTAFPHLTIALHQADAEAAITVPNGVRGGFRTKLREVGEGGFFDCNNREAGATDLAAFDELQGNGLRTPATLPKPEIRRRDGCSGRRRPSNDSAGQAQAGEISTRMDASDLRGRDAETLQYPGGICSPLLLQLFGRTVSSRGGSLRGGVDGNVTNHWLCPR